ALSKPRFAQTLSERAHQVRRIVRGRTLEKRHHWHWPLLRTSGERPGGRRTNNSFDEIASSHCLPRGLGPRQPCDYSRDLRQAEWGLNVILRSNILRTECPLWVKSRHMQCKTACPLYPRKRHRLRISAWLLWPKADSWIAAINAYLRTDIDVG